MQKTGRPLENWGTSVPLNEFGDSGVNDLIPPLVSDWGRWVDRSPSYDPNYGIPRELGMVTSSAPPIVVNGVVVVLVGHQPSYGQTRIEKRPWRYYGIRCTHWKLPMEISRDSAARRSRARNLAQRRVGMVRGYVVMGSSIRGPGTRTRLYRDKCLNHPELRWTSSWRQSFWWLYSCVGRPHR